MGWMWLGKAKAAIAGIAAAGLIACAAPMQASAAGEAAPAEARPALWRLADEDTTIYLFGTIHALPEGLEWRTPAMEAALAEADELVLELAPTDDPAAAAQLMLALGMADGLPPILERVPEEKREALRGMIERSGIPVQAYDRMKSWAAAALLLMAVNLRDLGVDAERGVEEGLSAPWRADGKEVSALETAEEQLGFFDKLSEEAQRLVLASTADDPEEARAQFAAMLEAWRTGDVDAIAATFDSETTLSPELRDVLMTRRNARWAEWLAERLERPGTVFVAVGAGHLAGRDSVQAMLARRGLEAERTQ